MTVTQPPVEVEQLATSPSEPEKKVMPTYGTPYSTRYGNPLLPSSQWLVRLKNPTNGPAGLSRRNSISPPPTLQRQIAYFSAERKDYADTLQPEQTQAIPPL